MSGVLTGIPQKQNINAISYLDSTVAPFSVNNGIPYEADARVAIDLVSAISHYSNGLPFTANGRLAVTLVGPPDRIASGPVPLSADGRVVFALGANAHFINGLGFTPNSSVNATTDAPSGLPIGFVFQNGNFTNENWDSGALFISGADARITVAGANQGNYLHLFEAMVGVTFVSKINGAEWTCTSISTETNLMGTTTAIEADYLTGFSYPATFLEKV